MMRHQTPRALTRAVCEHLCSELRVHIEAGGASWICALRGQDAPEAPSKPARKPKSKTARGHHAPPRHHAYYVVSNAYYVVSNAQCRSATTPNTTHHVPHTARMRDSRAEERKSVPVSYVRNAAADVRQNDVGVRAALTTGAIGLCFSAFVFRLPLPLSPPGRNEGECRVGTGAGGPPPVTLASDDVMTHD
eukprot:scaffold18285_cov35-Tisochrysis_lutea.AAC.4